MRRRGQGTLEYAVLIAVIIASFLALQHYMRRGIAGKLRSSAKEISQEQFSMGSTDRTVKTIYPNGYTSKEAFGIGIDTTEVATAQARGSGDANIGVSYYKPDSTNAVTRQTESYNANKTEDLYK